MLVSTTSWTELYIYVNFVAKGLTNGPQLAIKMREKMKNQKRLVNDGEGDELDDFEEAMNELDLYDK